MWLVDFVALIIASLLFVDQQEDVNEDGEPIERDETPLSTKLLHMTNTILFVLIQVFLFLKLDKYTNWNWFAVFSPWLAYEFVQVMMILPIAFGTTPPPNFETLSFNVDDEESGESDLLMKRSLLENEYFEKLFNRATERKALVGHLLRGWFAVFLALKLNGQVDWNWGLVFLPVWVSLLSQTLFAYYFRVWGISILETIDPRDLDAGSAMERNTKLVHGQQLLSASYIALFLTFVPAFMAILLVSRLQVMPSGPCLQFYESHLANNPYYSYRRQLLPLLSLFYLFSSGYAAAAVP
jgi:Transmembrane Fragile-X-F protein